MAITSASGGFNGNFSPIIYSKQAQIALRRAAVANAITNNSYFGEIANQGDVVRIQKEPDVTVNALERHTAISVEKLNDEDFSIGDLSYKGLTNLDDYINDEINRLEGKYNVNV